MQHELQNGTGFVWERYLERRNDARRTAMSEAEFGPQETERFDLDTADITGEDNPRTFKLERRGDREGPIDYRAIDPRFD